MKKALMLVLAVLVMGLNARSASAGSEAAFPGDWKKWESMNTTLTKIGALPGCEANVSTLPPIYQETVATYCAVRQGGPGKVKVLVNPATNGTYGARKGGYKDGSNLILHLTDMKVLFITSHKGGQPRYSIYTEDGKDISAASGPLSPETCRSCHTGYAAFCVEGQCGKVTK